MDKSSLHLGKIFGIEVRLHYTWFFIFLLLAWSLAGGYFPEKYPELTNIGYWVLGIVSAILLFVSVLFHEVSHSLVAKHYKINVDSITLFFFGGVAQLKERKFTPKNEFWISAAGPIFSLSLALIFFLITKLNTGMYLGAIASYLAMLNLILGLFNLVPGFPLDGGRILRAILWAKTKSLEKATYVAAEAGKAVAIFMIVFSIAAMIFGSFRFLWFLLIGMFLFTAAKASYRQTILKSVLDKVKVKNVMMKKFKSFSIETPLEKVNMNSLLKYGQDVFPVMEGKQILGLVGQHDINKAKQMSKKLKIGNLTLPITKVKPVKLDDDCYKALEKMVRQNISSLPVFDKGKFIGLVNASTLMKLVSLQIERSGIKKKK